MAVCLLEIEGIEKGGVQLYAKERKERQEFSRSARVYRKKEQQCQQQRQLVEFGVAVAQFLYAVGVPAARFKTFENGIGCCFRTASWGKVGTVKCLRKTLKQRIDT